ncbi:MAG: rRNA maturation RNase YbeY [Gallionella sp.]|jgi:probable rRNA maturation factor|nr:rRNA maturation RNase YbeY [Gallionella sp.]
MNSKKMPRLSLFVQYASTAPALPGRPQLRRWFQRALQRDLRVTLRLVDEAEGRELNRQFRGKDYATNVLTFVYDEPEGLSGDVVICIPVLQREAAEQGKSLTAHFAHLVIHAALHLQGYDHEDEADALEMESLERRLMLELRHPDPYQEL